MSQSRWRRLLLIWGGWLLFTLFLTVGPQSFYSRIASTVLHSSGVSLRLVDHMQAWVTQPAAANIPESIDPATNDAALTELNNQNRDLATLIATLQAENSQLKAIPEIPFEDGASPLRTVSALAANVIGRQGENFSGNHQLLIGLGTQQGLAGDELILQGKGLLIDQGLQSNLTHDQLVTIGKSLFGRTVEVGSWTSLVQPITDPDFRTAVLLVRKSDFGLVTGARGILKGTGSACEVIEVAGTEAVAVGDLVYTDINVSPTSTPIYCGRVIEASIDSNASHWTILVGPATSIDSLPSELTVIRTELNLGSGFDNSPR